MGEGTEKEGPLKAKKETPGRIEPSPCRPAATTLLPHPLKCLYDQGTKPKQRRIEFNISRMLFTHGPYGSRSHAEQVLGYWLI